MADATCSENRIANGFLRHKYTVMQTIEPTYASCCDSPWRLEKKVMLCPLGVHLDIPSPWDFRNLGP